MSEQPRSERVDTRWRRLCARLRRRRGRELTDAEKAASAVGGIVAASSNIPPSG